MMVEEISIFQNKMTTNFPNKVLEQVRAKSGVISSDQYDEENKSGHSVHEYVAAAPVVLQAGIIISLSSLLRHLGRQARLRFFWEEDYISSLTQLRSVMKAA